jgi:hypothetical protein
LKKKSKDKDKKEANEAEEYDSDDDVEQVYTAEEMRWLEEAADALSENEEFDCEYLEVNVSAS